MSTTPDTAAAPKRPNLLWILLGSFFFTGYSPFASGTVGSAAALALYWLLPFTANGTVLILGACVLLFIGLPAAQRLADFYGDDPSVVVIDEAAGMWFALAFLPKTWIVALAAFLLFRVFDIFKPQPAKYFDRMKGAGGIMMDDVVAGIYANIVLQVALLLF
jgi:phosphatidylglycerophosphatase A